MTAVVAFSVGVFARALGVEQAGGKGRELRLKEKQAEPSQSQRKSGLLSVSQITFQVFFSAVR